MIPAVAMEGWLIAFETGPRGNPLFWAVHIADQRAALAAVAAGVDVDTPVVSGPNQSSSIESFGPGPGPGEVAFVGDIGMPIT